MHLFNQKNDNSITSLAYVHILAVTVFTISATGWDKFFRVISWDILPTVLSVTQLRRNINSMFC